MLPIVFGEHVQVQTGRLFVVILALIAYAFAMRAPQGISDLAVSESLATPPAANCSFMTSENDCPARPALRQGLVSRHIDRDRLYGHAKEGVFIVILTKEQRAQSRAIS